MALFKARAIGGPDDGLIIDLLRAPQDREQITRLPEARRTANVRKLYAIYEFDQPNMLWKFIGMTKRKITSDVSG